MAIKDSMLPEFDQEMAVTRKVLERVPDDKLDWQPHAKSMSLARLAGHLAEIAGWGVMTLTQDSIDLAPPGGQAYVPQIPKSRQEILDKFEAGLKQGREALANASDETMMQPWSLLRGGETLMTLPKVAVLRTWVLSHNVHHRAQLSVYLRLLDVPVPSIYGPSADEAPF